MSAHLSLSHKIERESQSSYGKSVSLCGYRIYFFVKTIENESLTCIYGKWAKLDIKYNLLSKYTVVVTCLDCSVTV